MNKNDNCIRTIDGRHASQHSVFFPCSLGANLLEEGPEILKLAASNEENDKDLE